MASDSEDDYKTKPPLPSDGQYASLCKSRRYLRAQVTRIYNQVTQIYDSLSEVKIVSHRERLAYLKKELDKVNQSIHSILPDEEELDPILNDEETYTDRIVEALAILRPVEHDDSVASIGQVNGYSVANKLKLPTVELPEFSNSKAESLERFLHAFESILDKHRLSDYERFIYLKGQLRKGPKALVSSLEPGEQTYSCAKELLTKAFASPVTQKYDVIKRLSDLKLPFGADVYEFISEIRNIVSSIRLLEIDVDTIVQYFLWNGMNDRFQTQLIQITNKTKPDLKEIMDNIFAATERYQKLTDKRGERPFSPRENSNWQRFKHKEDSFGTNNLAVNVKTKAFRSCCLCVADQIPEIAHELRDCPVYDDPAEKIKKLETLKYCAKCSFTNHRTAACRFKFGSPCRKCKGAHLTYLCQNMNKEGRHKEVVASKISAVHFNSTINKDQVILPTFSAAIAKTNTSLVARILYDTGSQRNFIREAAVQKFGLKTLKANVDLTIHGFNSEKHIKTDIVAMPLVVDSAVITVEAIVVPSLDVTLNILQYKLIVDKFNDKGYELADSGMVGLTGKDSKIDAVMGPDAAKILCPQTIVFGNPSDPSVYLSTKVGIMLLGSADKLIENLSYLGPQPNFHQTEPGVVEQNSNTKPTEGVINVDHLVASSNTIMAEVLDDRGQVIESKLQQLAEQTLESFSDQVLGCESTSSNTESNELDNKVVDYVLRGTDRTAEGRLIMPLPWNPQCKHLLGQNYGLSKKILFSNLEKLKRNGHLSKYDEVFREQEQLQIIERVEDVDSFISQHPECSFLPHMGIFKLSRETTKVRVVYLSNLCEKNCSRPDAVSHNEALLPGPCLNSKISTSFLLSRFDKHILIFDISKAFLSIQLPERDQNRLLCLWFRNVSKNDFSIIAYRNLRLSFGLRPSPAVLMIALYKILILDVDNDDEETVQLKKLIYNNIYMDNGLVSADTPEILTSYYRKLPFIFNAYKMELQQFATNVETLQSTIDGALNSSTEGKIKFFGMQWDREADRLGPHPIKLDAKATTKRAMLSSLNGVYDLLNVYGPIINRAKIFFHQLQCNTNLKWDTPLSKEYCEEWTRICKQVNASPSLQVPRYVGPRDGKYNLIAFCDASSVSYGVVIYFVDTLNGNVSFGFAKNRIVNTKLTKKSIPSLECQAMAFAAEVLIDTYLELSGQCNYVPINIDQLFVYSDSMVCLAWIKAFFVQHHKMQKRSVFVQNRLKQIGDLCNRKSITFRYIEGKENPADCISRPFSYKQLQSTNYLTGPDFLKKLPSQPDIEVRIPIEDSKEGDFFSLEENAPLQLQARTSWPEQTALVPPSHWINPDNYSSLGKILRVYQLVLKYFDRLRVAVARRRGQTTVYLRSQEYGPKATKLFLRTEQSLYYPEIFEFFAKRDVPLNKTPPLILQLNLFLDEDSLIRVKCKLRNSGQCPILIPPNSRVANLIVRDIHEKNMHAGLYCTLRELRKKFWLPKGFSRVRAILRQCITCRKLNERPLKLNQNSYRSDRVEPPKVPFASIFLDYIGPVNVKLEGVTKKMWLLIITCVWSRAISLRICFSADTTEFLRALQCHIYQYGMFQHCVSDLGSQIVAGANIVSTFLDDVECEEFFQQYGVRTVKFEQYPKGNSSLGSLVETCVKQVKHLMIKTIGRKVLDFPDFDLLVSRTVSVINKRPIAFRESLRENCVREQVPEPITPEMLLHGRELLSLNIIPDFQPDRQPASFDSNDYLESIRKNYKALCLANERLIENYSNEFLVHLISQAVDKADRYKPVTHKKISVGDVVLLVEPNRKRNNYPMGVVHSVTENSIGEITSAVVLKGRTRERVHRHASTIIPLLRGEGADGKEDEIETDDEASTAEPTRNPVRRGASIVAREAIGEMYAQDTI